MKHSLPGTKVFDGVSKMERLVDPVSCPDMVRQDSDDNIYLFQISTYLPTSYNKIIICTTLQFTSSVDRMDKRLPVRA